MIGYLYILAGQRKTRGGERKYGGEEKDFTEAQPLRYRVHALDHREDYIGTLPTLSRKAAFHHCMMPQALFKDDGGSSHVGACNTRSIQF
jgi:hypothetical protein